ncbi:MAG: hypothetical protein ACRDHX_18115 [Chloroflexota bacterium]
MLSTDGVVAREPRELVGRHFVDFQEIRASVERIDVCSAESDRVRDFVRTPLAVARG